MPDSSANMQHCGVGAGASTAMETTDVSRSDASCCEKLTRGTKKTCYCTASVAAKRISLWGDSERLGKPNLTDLPSATASTTVFFRTALSFHAS